MQGKPTGDVMEKPLGITQAAPPPPPPPPAAPLTREQAVQASNVPAELKAMYGTAATEASRTNADIRKDLEAEYKAAGVEQRSPEERANLMKERANAEDEAHRQRYLRMAEMFAAWGSTPGPTLAAGLAAFKNSVPSLISDEKEATKIRKEIDKSLAGLDESIRLEKRGLVDKAADRKTAAVKKMEDIYTEVVKFKTKEVEAERAAEAQEKRDVRTGEREEAKDIRYANLQKEVTQMKIDADAKNNKMLADFRAADKAEAGKDRLITLYRGAQSDIASAESRIQNIMKSPEYQDALANSKATITKESGTAAVKMRDDAVEALKGFNESFKTQREAVDSTVKFMEDRLNAKGIELPVKKSKGSDKPPPLPPGAKLD
jgi:hypothetical protein